MLLRFAIYEQFGLDYDGGDYDSGGGYDGGDGSSDW